MNHQAPLRSLLRPLLVAAAAVSCSVGLAAQAPAPSGGQITSNARWVYVLVDGVLHQFDAETLQWKRSVPLPRTGRRPTAEVMEVDEEEIVEEEVVEDVEVTETEEAPESEPTRRKAPAAIRTSLDWLRRHQEEDGRFSASRFFEKDLPRDGSLTAKSAGAGVPVHDVATTALATLAFLGDGSTMRSGPDKDVITAAVGWLMRQQDPETGLVGVKAAHDYIYDHAVATYALVEAAGLSKARLTARSAQKAVDYLESHRNPYSAWRYEPRGGDSDTSVTGWCAFALFAAKSFDLKVEDSALEGAVNWVESMTDPKTGRVGYIERGGLSSRRAGNHGTRFPQDKNETMTAVGLSIHLLAKKMPDAEALSRMRDLLASKPPVWSEDGSTVDYIGWYFGTFATYQFGGRQWKAWEKALQKSLLRNQRTDGVFAGSWDPVGPWGQDGGRIMSTALATLSLQMYYRYGRLVR